MRRGLVMLGLLAVALTAPTAQAGSSGPFSTDKDTELRLGAAG